VLEDVLDDKISPTYAEREWSCAQPRGWES
jgi:hypothetical protein